MDSVHAAGVGDKRRSSSASSSPRGSGQLDTRSSVVDHADGGVTGDHSNRQSSSQHTAWWYVAWTIASLLTLLIFVGLASYAAAVHS